MNNSKADKLSFVNREPVIEFDLHLHGNRRNERNEMYRRRLADEVHLKK